MKKLSIVAVCAIVAIVLSNCGPSSKTGKTKMPQTTYENGIQTLIMANCTPCHIPAKGGNKKALDSYASVKGDIDDIIRRIELTPGERGFMPFKRGKLSDSTINAFRQWRTDGMPEK